MEKYCVLRRIINLKKNLFTQTKSKKKKNKDDNAPKRATTAFMLWLNETRDEIKRDNPGLKVTEIAKKAGEIWRELKDKSEWEEKAAKDKERYTNEMKNYKPSGGAEESGSKKRKKESSSPKKVTSTTMAGGGFKSKEYISEDDSSSGSDSDKKKKKKKVSSNGYSSLFSKSIESFNNFNFDFSQQKAETESEEEEEEEDEATGSGSDSD